MFFLGNLSDDMFLIIYGPYSLSPFIYYFFMQKMFFSEGDLALAAIYLINRLGVAGAVLQ